MLVVCFYKIKKFYRGCWNLYRNCKEVEELGGFGFGARGEGVSNVFYQQQLLVDLAVVPSVSWTKVLV